MTNSSGSNIYLANFSSTTKTVISNVSPDEFISKGLQNEDRPNLEPVMNSPSREEIDAKLETIEVKMDARVASIESKIDLFLASAAGTEQSLKHLAEKAVSASESAASSAERAGGLKSTLWITSITTVIAVLGIAFAAYFGTQQSNQGIVQTTLSAYEMGRAHSNSVQTPSEKVPDNADRTKTK